MTRNKRSPKLRTEPESGTQIAPTKIQGYQLPRHLWQELVDEVARRKKLGLKHASQNAIAVQSIVEWPEKNKGAA